MRNIIAKFLTGLSVILLLTLAAGFALNLRDEPLRSEVRKIWEAPDAPPSEAGRRAYLYLLGLAAGERVDPEVRGAELWPQLGEASVRDALDSTGWIKGDFAGCGESACGVVDLTPETRAYLARTQAAGALYAGWMDFADLAFVAPSLPIPGPRAHRLYTLRLASWLEAGGIERAWASLANSNQFYARVLANGPLEARVIALQNLTLNARFVAKEIARRPTVTVPADVLDAWRIPALPDILGGALVSEVRRLKDRLAEVGAGTARFATRPNETANRTFEIFNQTLFTDCPRPDRGCVPARAYAAWDRPDHWIINPRGRALVIEVTRDLARLPLLRENIAEILEMKARLRRRL